MKTVTFIYAYEPSEIWSTPLSLVKEFESRGWTTNIISIGSNRTGIYHDRDLREWVESKPQTDLVIFMDWGRFDSPYLNKDLVPAIWIQESGDDPQNYARNFPKASRGFHFTLTPDYTSYESYKQSGINALWWTHFADTRIHYPIPTDIEYVAVTSRGLGGSQFLDTLTKHGEGMIGNKNNMIGMEHTKFLQSGLMVVQNSRWGEITRRLFEAMACGKMVLTDRLAPSKKLDELFLDKQDIVYYNNMEECINLMNYYAEHHEERDLIAKNGRNKVLEFHTQRQRVDLILETLGL